MRGSQNNTVTAIALALICVGVIVWITASSARARIGLLVPTSGPLADAGEPMIVGAELAARDLGGAIEVVVADTAFDQPTAAARAQELIDQDVDALFSAYTHMTEVVSPVARDGSTPLFYDSCNCGFAEENPYAFQNYFNPRQECRQLAERARDTGVGKIAQISVDTDYADFCSDAFASVLGEENMFVHHIAPDAELDARTLLEEVHAFGAETVALVPSASSYHSLFAANQGRGFDTEFFCYEGACMLPGIVANIAPFTITNVYTFEVPVRESLRDRLAEYDFTDAEIFQAALAYDAVRYTHDAVEACGEDASVECFVAAVKNNTTYESQLDSTGFDADGFLEYTTEYNRYTEGIGERVELEY